MSISIDFNCFSIDHILYCSQKITLSEFVIEHCKWTHILLTKVDYENDIELRGGSQALVRIFSIRRASRSSPPSRTRSSTSSRPRRSSRAASRRRWPSARRWSRRRSARGRGWQNLLDVGECFVQMWAKCWHLLSRFRLHRHRLLQSNIHFAELFAIYKVCVLLHRYMSKKMMICSPKRCQCLPKLIKSCQMSDKIMTDCLQIFAKV